jgi:hypothetical protein
VRDDPAVLWAYGVTAAGEALPPLAGVAGGTVERVEHDGLALLVSAVPLAQFGETPLRANLNDLGWLEQVARAHEAVLEQVLAHATIVPLRLCTIFADEAGARRMLAERAGTLRDSLAALDGREEWSVKVLVDRDRLLAEAEPNDDDDAATGAGAAYLLRRRAERERTEAARRVAAGLAEDVHARLQDWASAAVVRPAQNPELSGHAGDMILNGAYLAERDRLPELYALVDELRDRHAGTGARIELSGPFPAYNFAGEGGP